MKHINSLIIIVFIIISAFGCKPDSLEFARPENLAGTVYTQLESMGNFNYYLQLIDQTEYKEPLEKGGSWTIFAPTDEAFEAYMTAEGYTSIDAIPSDKILDIIQYSIIIDAWNTTTLTYFNRGFYAGNSFKRFTQYKDSIEVLNADDYPNIMKWEPGQYRVDPSYGRNKPTVYFLDDYIEAKAGFETTDYAFMFPGETYNPGDMKVFEANVSQANIIAENGMIYALDKVIEPRKNLYQNLTSEEYGNKYTLFKSLLDRFAIFSDRGEVINDVGEPEQLYYLLFETGIVDNLLPFSPYDESYPRLLNNVDRTLANATGLLVPTNDALEQYLNGNSILGQFYDSYDAMPLDVLGKFLSTFFFRDFWSICPTNIGQSLNVALDLVDYKLEDVVDQKFCSNGFFVGIDEVYTNDNFSTIMGPLLLDSEYTIMLKAVQDLGIDNALLSKGSQFSVFGIKNDQFVNIADPNSATRTITVLLDETPEDLSVIYMQVDGDPVTANNRTYPDPNDSTPNSTDVDYVTTTLKDIVLNQIVEETVDLSSNNYYPTKSGEFIYAYEGNKVSGGGNIALNEPAQVISIQDTDNGKFYEMSRSVERPLKFTYGMLMEDPVRFSRFIEVLEAADALVNIPNYTGDKLVTFLNLLRTFTLLAPNNNAVNQAISDGIIVEPSTLGSLSPLEFAIAKQDLLNFVKKHFIQQAITTDGNTAGDFDSMYFSKVIDFVPVYDTYTFENNYATSTLTIKNPTTGDVITETASVTNLFSKRVVIHEIDNYLN
ncbi:fasciclin domain-containing protein [Flavivirga aquimarina]|uniref:Fasciclin domain-containing protein n=1 Tax=Flavivirga aquimarina TaxID=2027862 RepID=A0ABT8WDU9_9FLAO|nr:fasciclin domain-containing protein [Flavivirga aquimarina]MDO5971339.1 fasciclin domain-containing protein [Flavivirga aquimarina]